MVSANPSARHVIRASMALVVIAFFLPWIQLFPPASKKQAPRNKPAAPQRKPTASSTPLFTGRMRTVVSEFNQGATSIRVSFNRTLRLSGFTIPQAANSQTAKAAVQLAEMFQKKNSDVRTQLRQAGPRAYAVYLVPLAHLLFGSLLLKFSKVDWIVGIIGFIAGLVAPIGYWQVMQALAQSQGLAQASYGLWLSLAAYWGLTYAAALLLRQHRRA